MQSIQQRPMMNLARRFPTKKLMLELFFSGWKIKLTIPSRHPRSATAANWGNIFIHINSSEIFSSDHMQPCNPTMFASFPGSNYI